MFHNCESLDYSSGIIRSKGTRSKRQRRASDIPVDVSLISGYCPVPLIAAILDFQRPSHNSTVYFGRIKRVPVLREKVMSSMDMVRIIEEPGSDGTGRGFCCPLRCKNSLELQSQCILKLD